MPEHQQIQQSKKPYTTFQKQATPVIQTPLSNPYSIIQRARINPRSLTHADIMQLQRTIGNQAVGRLLSSIGNTSISQQATVQRQDILEEEEKPMQGKFENVQRSETPEEEEPLQGKMAGTVQRQEIPEEEPPMQGKFESIQRQKIPEDEEPLQGKFEDKPEIACPSCFAASIVQKQESEEKEKPLQGKLIGTIQRQEIPEEKELLQTKKENNTGMPDNLKAGVESLSGIDMSDVRVQYSSSKPAEVGALAYTQGTNIHVAPGQERHLPHEAWHVVQQMHMRVKPTMQVKGVSINDDVALEREADVMGAKALQTTRDDQIVKSSTSLTSTSLQRRKRATSPNLSSRLETIQRAVNDGRNAAFQGESNLAAMTAVIATIPRQIPSQVQAMRRIVESVFGQLPDGSWGPTQVERLEPIFDIAWYQVLVPQLHGPPTLAMAQTLIPRIVAAMIGAPPLWVRLLDASAPDGSGITITHGIHEGVRYPETSWYFDFTFDDHQPGDGIWHVLVKRDATIPSNPTYAFINIR